MGYLDKLRAARDAASQAMSDARVMQEQMVGPDPYLNDKSLRGPAGRYVYGLHLSKAEREAQRQPVTLAADPAGQTRAEVAARFAARAPYVAPDVVPVTVTRIPATERTSIEAVRRFLADSGLAARPDRVHGLYRVPDHVGGGFARDRYVEWEVVHEADRGHDPTPPAAAPPVARWFDACERWVARRRHEPMVHDEEVALAYLLRAGIGPEATFGIARHLATHQASTSDDNGGFTAGYVTGVHAWHAGGAGDGGEAAWAWMTSERPLLLPPEPPDEVRLEVLNWAGVRKAVAPVTGRPPLSPSPFPHLPSTAQELLVAYLDVVGVRAADCYAASVTEDVPRNLDSVSMAGGITLGTNVGQQLPCADGRSRSRLHGGARIVVAYRDRPAYGEGRDRFAAYERDVLQSQLARGAERRPLEYEDLTDHLPRGLRGAVNAGLAVGRFVTADTYDVLEKLPPFRYCWPPVDQS